MSVLVERRGAVTLLTLNRPDRLNAFTVDMTTRLSAAFTEAEEDKAVRVIVLTGAGRGFCAGQDLSERSVAPGLRDREAHGPHGPKRHHLKGSP